MRQTTLVTLVVSSLTSILVTLAAMTFVIPQRAAAQSPPTVLVAERFVLQDPEGNVRALLQFGPDGEPVLAMRDHEGRPRVRIGIRPDGGPFVLLHDPDFSRRVALAIGREGEAQLVLREPGTAIQAEDPRFRAGFFVTLDGTPAIELRDAQGTRTWAAP